MQSIAACRKGTNNKYEFKFDRVFGPLATQAEVFEEISQLVQVSDHFAVGRWVHKFIGEFPMTGKVWKSKRSRAG